jgi:hypothetical protein
VVLLLLFAVAAPLLSAAPTGDTARDFARAVQSYERGDYAVAARLFARVAARDPRAPDAWANFGTAAWATSDTANATLGWQRALRLEPLAADVRDRVALAGADAGAGRVLPVPPLALALGAAALWLAAWGLAAGRAARRLPVATPPVGSALVLSLALAAATWAQEDHLAARGLAVVARGQPLHVSATLTADPTGSVRTGEVTRVLARAGAWARVEAGPGQDGWLPAAALLPLAQDAPAAIELGRGAP